MKKLISVALAILLVQQAAGTLAGARPFGHFVGPQSGLDAREAQVARPQVAVSPRGQLVMDKAVEYAIELGCKNLGEIVLLARTGQEVRDSDLDNLELVDFLDPEVRTKKAAPKLPRFGKR